MSKGNGGFKRRTKQPVSPENGKQALWIRPHDSPLEVEVGGRKVRPFAPQHIPTSKNILRVGFNLVGVSIVLVSAWFLIANITAKGEGIFIGITPVPRTPELAVCADIQRCIATTPTTSRSKPGTTPTLSTSPQASPTSIVNGGLTPTPTQSPTPQPTVGITATPDPTPSTAILQVVPQSLTISRASVCRIGALTPLTLINQGGTPLLWSQDTANTSTGLTIIDPGRTYLIQPGQTASGSVRCARFLAAGKYKLGIDFNGGMVSISILVTA